MDRLSRRRRPGWVPWAELEAAIGADFPGINPDAVFLAVEDDQVRHRLRCEPGGGGDLVPLFTMEWGFTSDTVIPYKLKPKDWDVFDRERGLLRNYPLEVSWRDVLQLLEKPAAPPITIDAIATSPDQPALNPQTECQRRLEAIMREDQFNTAQRKNGDLLADMREELPGLSEAAFRRARKDAIVAAGTPAWKRPGTKGRRRRESLRHSLSSGS